MRVAVPRMGERVAPCLEYCRELTVFTVEGRTVRERRDFTLQSTDPFDRVRLLRDQRVQVILCDGIQAAYETALRASGIRVIAWVSGTVDDLLALFLGGRLNLAESAGPEGASPAPPVI